MGVEDILGKAKNLFKGEQAEEISDNVLDKAADIANAATDGKFKDQVGDVRDAIDGKIGNE